MAASADDLEDVGVYMRLGFEEDSTGDLVAFLTTAEASALSEALRQSARYGELHRQLAAELAAESQERHGLTVV